MRIAALYAENDEQVAWQILRQVALVPSLPPRCPRIEQISGTWLTSGEAMKIVQDVHYGI